MNPRRWQRVEALFAALLDASEQERRTALASAANTDVASEVETLLRSHDELRASGSGFLERLDSQRAAALVEVTETGPDIAAIGRYPVVRRLARGGMGVVYLARDTRLDRLVALKLLPDYRSSDAHAVDRLSAEARTASALDHPNIGTIHEIAESEDGRLFIAMAYYEGETLRERLARGPIPVAEVVRLGVQLAEGLSAAHRAGVVHRDIKPENLIITEAGVLKIVDFGIATAITDDPARGGPPRGTPAYMSPEQARGEPTDQRTDIWSAGVVLHEMLAGARPQGAPTPATGRSDAPPALAALVRRCLEPDPDRRLASAALLAAELRAVGPRAGRRRRLARASAGALAAAAVVVWVISANDAASPPADPDATAAPAIAILPFQVRGGELEIWREGMVDLIATNLDGVTGLRAIDSRTVLAGWHALEREAPLDFDDAVAFARRTGAEYAVFGSVVSSGAGIRISSQIVSLADAGSLGTVSVEGPADSIFSLVDRLSIDLLGAIWQGRERPDGDVGLARLTTSSLPGLKAYLNGERALRQADFAGAAGDYERAIAADSTFAFALYHLGLARGWLGGDSGGVLAVRAMQRALRHADRLPEREWLLLQSALDIHASQTYDLSATLRRLRTATQQYPDDAEAWYLLGELAYHAGDQLLLDWEESESAFRNAVTLDPAFAVPYIHLIHNAFERRPDSARAARLIAAYQRLAPASPIAIENRLAFAIGFGDSAQRRRALAALDTIPPAGFGGWNILNHPRTWEAGLAALEAQPRPRTPVGRVMAANRVRFNVGLGRLGAAHEALRDPTIFPGLRSAILYQLNVSGVVPDSVLDTTLATPEPDTSATGVGMLFGAFYAGAYAADRSRWNDYAVALGHLRARAERLRASGDSGAARFAAGTAAALEAHGLRRRGDTQRAYTLMAEAQIRTTWLSSMTRNALNETLRWWLGEMLLEMGRPRDAVRYFESLWPHPLAAYRRAVVYEELGDTARAREAYLFFASAWRGADPDLQPRVAAARAAAERLAGGQSAAPATVPRPPRTPASARSAPRPGL